MYALAVVGFLLTSVVCVGIIIYGLHRVAIAANLPVAQRRRMVWGTLVVVSGWMIGIGAFAAAGVLNDFASFPPRMLIVLLPPLLTLLFIIFRPGFAQLLRCVPPAWIVGIQSFRIVVEVLLWLLLLQGLLPVQLTFEGYNFDVLTGLTALPVMYGIATKRISNRAVIAWNIAGLFLLLIIVSMAILSMPIPIRVFMNEPSNTIVTQFPFIWLPGVLVPIAYSMHFFSLRQMAIISRNENR